MRSKKSTHLRRASHVSGAACGQQHDAHTRGAKLVCNEVRLRTTRHQGAHTCPAALLESALSTTSGTAPSAARTNHTPVWPRESASSSRRHGTANCVATLGGAASGGTAATRARCSAKCSAETHCMSAPSASACPAPVRKANDILAPAGSCGYVVVIVMPARCASLRGGNQSQDTTAGRGGKERDTHSALRVWNCSASAAHTSAPGDRQGRTRVVSSAVRARRDRSKRARAHSQQA